jgi:hypothetical protein
MTRGCLALCLLAACRPPGPPRIATGNHANVAAEPGRPPGNATATPRGDAAAGGGAQAPWGTEPRAEWVSLHAAAETALAGTLPPGRVALARRGSVWLHPDGPAHGEPPAVPLPAVSSVATIPDPHGLRLLTEFAGARVLVYASPDDLTTVTTATTPLHAAPATAAPGADARIELLAGAPLEVIERRSPWVRIAHHWDGSSLHGWLLEERLGAEFRPEPPRGPATTARALRIDGPLHLTDRDGKASVLSLPSADEPRWVTDEGRLGKRIRVRFTPTCSPHFVATGYLDRARARSMAPPPRDCPPEAPVHFGELEGAPRTTVPAGTELLERPGGQVVGVTLRRLELATDDAGVHWLPSPWGPLPVAVPPVTTRPR